MDARSVRRASTGVICLSPSTSPERYFSDAVAETPALNNKTNANRTARLLFAFFIKPSSFLNQFLNMLRGGGSYGIPTLRGCGSRSCFYATVI